MPWMLAAGMAASALGGAIGNAASSGDRDAALRAQQAALAQYQGINLPSVGSQQVNLQGLQSAGVLSPQQEQALSQQQSGLNGYSTNPALAKAQMGALNSLQQIGKTGMNATDQAQLAGLRAQSAQANNANMQSIMQNMAMRGQGAGMGAELASKLAANQQASQQNNADSLNIAGQAQSRALQAMQAGGNMATSMRGQNFNEASQKASAQDAINRFNTTNTQATQMRNVNAANAAQEYNLNNNQRISDTNTGLANQQQMYNKQLAQQYFQNQMSQANGMSGAYNNLSGQYGKNAQATAQMWGGMGQGAGNAMGAYGLGQMMQQTPQTQNTPTTDGYSGAGTQYGSYGADGSPNMNINYNFPSLGYGTP